MKKQISVYMTAFMVLLLALIIVLFPQQSFKAALSGVHTWFNIVFPSLLPFFIGTELLISLGIVNFISIMLEPIMRPAFNTPGCSSFAYIMSITSGYPTGARITARLRQEGLITKTEGERMLTFCSTSGPLFITGAVAVGMLNSSSAGWILLASHYLASITTGIIFRFYKYKEHPSAISFHEHHSGFFKALSELYKTYNARKEPLGQILSKSVNNSIVTLLNICGFIVLFSVIINILNITGILNVLAILLGNKSWSKPLLAGIIEMTIGSKMISQIFMPTWEKLPFLSFIIAWGGLSVHAQVAAVTVGTDLSLKPYLIAKFIQGIVASMYSAVLMHINQPTYVPVFADISSSWSIIVQSSRFFTIAVIIIMSLAIIAAIRHIKIIKF